MSKKNNKQNKPEALSEEQTTAEELNEAAEAQTAAEENNEAAEEITEAQTEAEETNEASEVQTEDSEEPADEKSALKSSGKQSNKAKSKRKFNVRSFKHGTMSVILTIVFIAAVVVVNVIVGLISERFDTTADLTDDGSYTLQEKTQNYLSDQLNGDVTITVLATEQDFEAQGTSYKQINELLKKMEMASSHITLKYLDLNQNPNYSAEFTGETIAAGYIVVDSPVTGRHRILTRGDYFAVTDSLSSYDSSVIEQYIQYYGSYVIEGANIEQAAVSAMMYVSNDELVKVAFTEGYGEQDSSALQTLLKKNGYEVTTLDLNTSEIPDDVDFVVMFGPTMDLSNENLSKIDKFLDNGGAFGKNFFYFASAQQQETPNIDAFLADWGMKVDFSVVGQSDTSYLISNYTAYAHLQQILDTDYAGNLYGNGLYTFGSDLRPVIQLWEGGARGGVEQEVLMTTYDKAFLFPLDIGDDDPFSVDTAESGTFNDVVVAHRIHSTTQELSNVAVFGSTELANATFMSMSNANNQAFFINIFNYISGKEDSIIITSKTTTSVTFEMSASTANTLAVVLCIVIPVVVIVLGIIIWVRRRHR